MSIYKTIFVPATSKRSIGQMKINGDDTARTVQATLEEQVKAGYLLDQMSPIIAHYGNASYTDGFILTFKKAP